MCALTKSKGDGHLLFAYGLLQLSYVSVDLRIDFSSGFKKRVGMNTYRVVGSLRKPDLLLRSPHNFFQQPTNMSQVPSCAFG